MTNPWLVSLSAVFLWWFSTGAILWRVRYADRNGRDAHICSVLLGLPLFVGGFAGLHSTLGEDSVRGVYVAFLSALAIWGWIELAFLSGLITGPNRQPCPPSANLVQRFLRASATILWHELALIAALLAIWLMSGDVANTTGLWTFAILFFARISAKLNLFFGVPRINTEFLPRPLAHLASHFRYARMNWLFPISITALTFAAGCWMERAYAATSDAMLVGYILLTVLTLLAVLEHWFMVLPLPDQKLWRWMLPEPPRPPQVQLREATMIRPKVPDALPTGRT
jgi:putative photosynthetic complex assembly protein 2